MANAFYDRGRNAFAKGEIHWNTGGDSFSVVLVDTGSYTVDLASHEFLSDITAGARIATATLTVAAPTAGVLDATDVTFTSVTGNQSEALVIYKDTGSAATSQLLMYIDTATGLPVTPNGGNISVAWDNGSNRIAKL